MTTIACPDLESIAALLDPGAATPTARAHVDGGCPRCDRRLAILRDLEALLTRSVLEPASFAVLNFARSLPREQQSQPAGRSIWRELVAVVMGPPDLVPAYRSAVALGAPLHYRAGDFEIDLTMLESGALVGQVLPIDPDEVELASGDTYLYGGGSALASTLLSTGEFRFAGVGHGTFTLVIETADTRIVVPDLVLDGH